MKWETPSELVAYLRASPSSDAGRAAADVIEQLVRQNDSKRDIIAHQAKLNEAANAEIGRLRQALAYYVHCFEQHNITNTHGARDFDFTGQIATMARALLARYGKPAQAEKVGAQHAEWEDFPE